MPILSPLAINEHTAKDFFAFVQEISKTDCNYVMVSLDVESLFTNMSLEGAIENCVNDFFLINLKLIICLNRMYMTYCQLQQKNRFLFLTTVFIVK